MKLLKKTTARVFVAVVACGSAAGIALTVGVAAGSDQGTSTPTRVVSAVAASVPSGLATSYRVLGASSSTAMPTRLGSDLGYAKQGYGVNPSLGREAGSVGNQHLWLVPGSSGSCLELGDGGSACGSNAVTEHRGLWLMLKPVSGAVPTIYGIVPDGATVSADAASPRISRSGNAVTVTPTSDSSGQIGIHTANRTVDIPVPPATGQPQ